VAALANGTSTATKTWHFKLKNARDLGLLQRHFILDGLKLIKWKKTLAYQLIG
jgi:hypothetical protein